MSSKLLSQLLASGASSDLIDLLTGGGSASDLLDLLETLLQSQGRRRFRRLIRRLIRLFLNNQGISRKKLICLIRKFLMQLLGSGTVFSGSMNNGSLISTVVA